MIYINFETNTLVGKIFDEDINPANIIKNIEVIFGKKIEKEKTLIFFDEIQRNTGVVSSLKYFCENAKDYFIIAAGSLLGIYIWRVSIK